MRSSDSTIGVLIVDRNAEDRQFLRLALSQSRRNEIHLEFCDTVEESESKLRQDEIDLLMIGAEVAGDDVLDQLTRARAIAPEVAVIVLAHRFDSATASQCVARGAQDCLPKSDTSPASLRRAIHLSVQRQRGVTRLLARHESLAAELARYDERRQRNHRFLRSVSHDFRTPLTVITEYASLISDGVVGEAPQDPKQKRFLQIISDRADDLNTMVDNLLDATKLEAHCVSLWRKCCRLNDAVRNVESNLRNKAAVKEVDLELQIDENLPDIFVDDEKVGRILNNVVSCAIQSSGPGGRVQLTTQIDQANKNLVVNVQDTRPHFDDESEAELFQSFSTNGPDSDCKGISLSLSVAKELTQLNLGDLTRTVVADRGTQVSISLPLADAHEIARRFQQCLGDSAVLRIVEIHAGDSKENVGAEIDALLNLILQPNDLLFPQPSSRWLLLIPCQDAGIDEINDRIDEYRQRAQQWLRDTNQRRGNNALPSIEFRLLDKLPPPEASAPVAPAIDLPAVETLSAGST